MKKTETKFYLRISYEFSYILKDEFVNGDYQTTLYDLSSGFVCLGIYQDYYSPFHFKEISEQEAALLI